MPNARTKAAAPEPAAAAAETTGEPRTITFRGLELTGPAILPGTLLFDLADLEDADDESLAPFIRVLRGCLGDEQVKLVRRKLDEDGVGIDTVVEVLDELTRSIFEAYGMAKADASQDS